MKKTIASYAGIVLGLVVASNWADLLSFSDYRTLLIFALILFLVDIFIKPIVSLVCLPVNLLTLGLFSLIINTAMIYLVNHIYPGLNLSGFASTFLAALLIVFFRLLLKRLLAG